MILQLLLIYTYEIDSYSEPEILSEIFDLQTISVVLRPKVQQQSFVSSVHLTSGENVQKLFVNIGQAGRRIRLWALAQIQSKILYNLWRFNTLYIYRVTHKRCDYQNKRTEPTAISTNVFNEISLLQVSMQCKTVFILYNIK